MTNLFLWAFIWTQRIVNAVGPLRGAHIDCDAEVITVNNHEDIALLAACKKVRGSITIRGEVSGEVSLDGIKTIEGYVNVEYNPHITKIGSSSIERVGGLTLYHLDSLSIVKFPRIVTIGSELTIQNCPQLRKLEFPSIQNAQLAFIIRTGLRELSLNMKTVNWIQIEGNSFLHQLFLPAEHIFNDLYIVENARNISVDLPHLAATHVLQFKRDSQPYNRIGDDSGTIPPLSLKLESLRFVHDIFIESSYPMRSIEFSALQRVAGEVSIVANFQYFAAYSLKVVDGNFSIEGAINEICLDEPIFFHQDVHLSSTNTKFDCSDIDDIRQRKFIDGAYSCQIGNRFSEWSDESVSARQSEQFRSQLWKTLVAIFSVLCCSSIAILLVIRHSRRKQSAKDRPTGQTASELAGEAQPLLAPSGAIGELATTIRTNELETDNEVRELSDHHGHSELVGSTGDGREPGISNLYELSDT